MESEKNMGFRNAISGYNKTDVKEYISKMAEEAARREDAWDTERGKLLRAAENARVEQEAAAVFTAAYSQLNVTPVRSAGGAVDSGNQGAVGVH